MALFEIGQLVMTQGIASIARDNKQLIPELAECIHKYTQGEWGTLCDEDKKENESALKKGNRLMGSYEVGEQGTKVWIITEWDRSVTTVLLPEEY